MHTFHTHLSHLQCLELSSKLLISGIMPGMQFTNVQNQSEVIKISQEFYVLSLGMEEKHFLHTKLQCKAKSS